MTKPAHISPLIVFDLDGTLVETAGDLIATLNVVLLGEGAAPVPVAAARSMVGNGARALIRSGLAASGREVSAAHLETLFTAFLGHYEANIADHSFTYPGVAAALDRLAASGFAFAICTNKIASASVKLCRVLGIEERFRAICGQDSFSVCKPHGDALLQTIAQAGGHPSQTLMVGDSRTDIATARAAGVPVIAVDFGYSDVPVAQLHPDCVISHFDQLWGAIGDLRERKILPSSWAA